MRLKKTRGSVAPVINKVTRHSYIHIEQQQIGRLLLHLPCRRTHSSRELLTRHRHVASVLNPGKLTAPSDFNMKHVYIARERGV